MKNRRINQIINELITCGKLNDNDYCAEYFRVSTRTIQNDLNAISEMLADHYQLCLTKDANQNWTLQGSEEQIQLFHDDYRTEEKQFLSPTEQRQLAIMNKLLINGETVSYQALSEEFFVSRSSIAADMKTIKKFFLLDRNYLETNNSGTFFVGDEYQRQNILLQFILSMDQHHTGDANSLKPLYRSLFGDAMVSTLSLILDEFFGKLKHRVNNQSMKVIQTSLVIMVGRILQGHRIELVEEDPFNFEQLHDMTTYFLTLELSDLMESAFEIKLTDAELRSINKLFIASGIEPIKNDVEVTEKYIDLIDAAIKKMAYSTEVPLENDRLLREGLITHIIPMIYRLQNDINITNPLLDVIKEKYSVMYGLTWFVMMDIEKELNLNLTEDEVAFIMVHFQAAIERHRQSIRVLFVCPNGYGTSSLIASQVKQLLPNIDSYETLSLSKIGSKDLSQFDFIISTVPLEAQEQTEEQTIIKISPILTRQDVKIILEHYGEWFIQRSAITNRNMATNSLLSEVLRPKDIYLNHSLNEKEEVIGFLCDELVAEGCVTNEFKESVYGRESLAPTHMSNGVAMPHGNPHFVTKSKIKIFVNPQQTIWDDEKIDVVILLAIHKEDVEHVEPILQTLFNIIFDRQMIEAIFFQEEGQYIYDNIVKGVVNYG
ncbi:BglG family transcription antiterminator [Numidum massiliense]|uniref:BglG family transcription antiterminator n=1 Tax=Numidum massiliense TaxID=1522315 RepID=UPI0006D59076|nr:PRD domain-containing protein [Numidum massiliense]